MLRLMSAEVRLELARSDDAEPISALSRVLIERGLTPSWPPARVLWHMRHAESVVLVARANAGLLGFAIMSFGAESAHLNLLAVDHRAHRRGIGRRLVAWLEATALTAGTFLISLELRAGNADALGFYRSLGYRETGYVAGYYQGIEDARRMQRDVRISDASRVPHRRLDGEA